MPNTLQTTLKLPAPIQIPKTSLPANLDVVNRIYMQTTKRHLGMKKFNQLVKRNLASYN